MVKKSSAIQLLPASRFSIEALTDVYNQARVDYLVPMQMDAARLAEYIHNYDVDLDHSYVARAEDQVLGITMLGVRPGRTWVTRLGVLPNRRRLGAGRVLVQALLDDTRALGAQVSILEVIQGNEPAHALFCKLGFRDRRELLVLRRPPGMPAPAPSDEVRWLEGEAALALLPAHPIRPPWTNEVESYSRCGGARALRASLGTRGSGWLVFREQQALLSHFIFHTETGEPSTVAAALLAGLYRRYPTTGTFIENIPADDPHLPALWEMGFMEVFRRMEMVWEG